MIITEQKMPLFDYNGDRIPQGLSSCVCDPDGCRLNQPALEYNNFVNRITRLHECSGVDTGVTAEEFKTETERLLGLIRSNPRVANIVNGVYLPVVLPQLTTDDIGEIIHQYLINAVSESYIRTFPSRYFTCFENVSAGKVSIADGSRHDQLIDKMKQEPVIGIHFPNPLQGYSVNASREQMLILPEGFILSGIDTLIAMAMYPDVLARGAFAPTLNLTALIWNSDYTFSFKSCSDNLIFRALEYQAFVFGSISGGLLFIG